jgi:hypothetical protein
MQVVKYAFNTGPGGAAPEAVDVCSRYIHEEAFSNAVNCEINLAF